MQDRRQLSARAKLDEMELIDELKRLQNANSR